jgi:ubiquinone/menaquinone biosynthesis C-methylase UbiE
LVDLAARATDPEALDLGVPEHEALRSLADLRFVNRWLGNRRRMAAAVEGLLDGAARPTLLDVGAGSGDVAAYLRRRSGDRLRVVLVDLKRLHLQAAPDDLGRVVADVRRVPFPPRSFDVVTASLFLHHFDAPELPGLLQALYALCRRGLVVNDLERSKVPYTFGRVMFPLLFQSRVSIEDGLVSIRRGFTPSELGAGFEEAGIPDVRVTATWPYRLLAVAARPPEPRR